MRVVGRLLGLRRRRGEHPPRGQLIDPIDGMPVGDLCQDILEVCLGIYAVELCGLHQCIDGCCTITACVGTTEEVVLPSQRHYPFILPMSGKSWKSDTVGIPISGARSWFGG